MVRFVNSRNEVVSKPSFVSWSKLKQGSSAQLPKLVEKQRDINT